MTKPDGVREALNELLDKNRNRNRHWKSFEINVSQAAHAIREYLAGELEGLKKESEKIPYSDCSQGSGSIGLDPSETFVTIEQQYYTITHEEYNQAITAAQERVRKGGE